METQLALFDFDGGPQGDLVVGPVNYQTIKDACINWHYAKILPNAVTNTYGVWENQHFQGVLVFGHPVARLAHTTFELKPFQVRELLRIAMRGHDRPLTAIMSKAIKHLRTDAPKVELLLSYADPKAGHLGTIYQAASWVYLGQPRSNVVWFIKGKEMHPRAVVHRYGTESADWIRENVDPKAERRYAEAKHKYAFGLNRQMKKALSRMALPYPKGEQDE